MPLEVWTLAEQDAGRLRPISYELLSWGRDLTDRYRDLGSPDAKLCSVVVGERVVRADLEDLIARGADRVYVVQSPKLAHFLVRPHAAAVEQLVKERSPEVFIAGATTTGRTLMPYLAVKLHTGLTADCTGLDVDAETGNLVQTRPAIGGNILATIVTPDHRPQMSTVRPRSRRAPHADPARQGEIVAVDVPEARLETSVEWLGFESIEADEANIQDADKVVSGGRGVRKAEHFALVRELAHALGAAVGASRDAVDRGWIAYPHQVGLSGKTVTPRLYVALGISGAIQHLAGMKTSEVTVAVNNDPDAQIFRVADVGVVGDLFEFAPALIQEIDRRRAKGGAA